jgi:hypothetical protein
MSFIFSDIFSNNVPSSIIPNFSFVSSAVFFIFLTILELTAAETPCHAKLIDLSTNHQIVPPHKSSFTAPSKAPQANKTNNLLYQVSVNPVLFQNIQNTKPTIPIVNNTPQVLLLKRASVICPGVEFGFFTTDIKFTPSFDFLKA